MPAAPTKSTTNDPSHAIASCTLDTAGRAQQEARYRRLAKTATVHRTKDAVIVQFDEHLDVDLLEQTLAVERECCGFFVFQFDIGERRLTITVRDPELTPALDVLATAFDRSS